MEPISGKTKTGLIIGGIITALIAAELLLRGMSFFAGRIFPHEPAQRDPDTGKTARVILCLGDSFTYGIGAGFENSYPVQLERVLNARSPKEKFVVFNYGVPGNNSTQVLEKMRAAFFRTRPDAVVVMSGCNDNWNFSRVAWQWNWPALLADLLVSRSKLTRLIAVYSQQREAARPVLSRRTGDALAERTRDPGKLIAYGNVYRGYGQYDRAVIFYKKAIALSPQYRTGLLELGRCYRLNREYRKAVAALAGAIRLDPDDAEIYAEIDDAFIGLDNVTETIRFYTELMDGFPGSLPARRGLARAYAYRAGQLFLTNQLDAAYEAYAAAAALDPENAKAKEGTGIVAGFRGRQRFNFAFMAQGQDYSLPNVLMGCIVVKNLPPQKIAEELLYRNLSAMVRLCRQYHVPLIFSGYPEDIPVAMREVAGLYEIPCVDHLSGFERLQAFVPGSRFFVSAEDRHCTAAGYRIMAENIAEALIPVINARNNESVVVGK